MRAAARDCGTTNYFSGWVTVELDGHEQRLALAAGRHGAREHLAGDAVVDAHGVAGPRAIGHVGAPHCLQNRPWTGAPHAVQKFCPVGGGGGMIGSHASAGVAGTGWPAVVFVAALSEYDQARDPSNPSPLTFNLCPAAPRTPCRVFFPWAEVISR